MAARTLLNELKRRYGPVLGRRMYEEHLKRSPGAAKLAPLTAGAQRRHDLVWGQMTGGGGRVPPDPATRPKGLDEEREARNFMRRAQKQKVGSKEQVEATAKWREDRRQKNLAASQKRWAAHQRSTIDKTIGEGVFHGDIEEDLVMARPIDAKFDVDFTEDHPFRVDPIAPGTGLAEGKTDADREAANVNLRKWELSKRRQNRASQVQRYKVVKTDIDLPGGKPAPSIQRPPGIPANQPFPTGTFGEAEKLHVRVPAKTSTREGYSKEYANKFAMRELLKEKRKAQWRAIARKRKQWRWQRRQRRRFNV